MLPNSSRVHATQCDTMYSSETAACLRCVRHRVSAAEEASEEAAALVRAGRRDLGVGVFAVAPLSGGHGLLD